MRPFKCFLGYHSIIEIEFKSYYEAKQKIKCCTKCEYTEWEFITGFREITERTPKMKELLEAELKK